MKEILIPLNFTTNPTVYDTLQSFSTSDEASGVLTFTTTADVAGTVASLTIRNASENANRQTVRIERLDVNSSPFSYTFKNPLPFGQYEGTVLLKKNLTVIASARFLFGVNSSLSAEVLPDLVKAYALDELVENVETEVSHLKDAFNMTVSETVKGVNKTESSLQAQENVRYLNEHQRKANELERISNENARIAAELARKDTFDTLVDSEVIEQTVVQEVAEKYQEIEALNAPEMVSFRQQLAEKADLSQLSQVASPLVASLAAQMTDTTRIYVYTGAEGGYVAGNWYYHNGTAFVSGGVYQSSGIGDDSITPIYLKSTVREAIGSFALDPKDLQFGFYNGGSTFYENDGYFSIKNPCQPFDIYKLGFVAAFQNCVNFYDADFVYQSSLAIPTFESTPYIDLEIVMPDGCYWYTISSKILEGANNEDNIFAKKYTLNANRNPFKLFADFDGTDLYIKSKYDATRDLCINIRKRGGNMLPDFEKIFLTANTEKFVDTNLFPSTILLTNSTDWFAPFKVRAINTIDGDLPENWYIHFTGGNHQYNNTGSGSTATARCADFKVLFDGVAVTDASEFCNIVEVIWTNYIQGQNTKKADGTGREILKETIHLRFDGDICAYENVLEPLEDIRLYQYYGLQHYNNNANSVRFVGGSNRAIVASSASANSGNDKCNAVQAFTNNLLVEFGIDKNTDLGQLDKLVLQAHSAFTSNDKAYFNIIDVDADGVDAVVTDGALYALKGYYKFSKPI